MEILFYHPSFDNAFWVNALRKALPDANIRVWTPGDNAPADYALVWHPPVEMLEGRKLKAVFALGAGVDAILGQLKAHPQMLDASVPLFRLEDTGMAQQMQEYAVSQVLHWFRRFDDYQALKGEAKWQPLAEYAHEAFTVAFLAQACWVQKSPKRSVRGDSRCAAGAAAEKICRASPVLPVRKSWGSSCMAREC